MLGGKISIAVLVSGGGTNFQALIDAEKSGNMPHCSLDLCLASDSTAYALERAKSADIAIEVVDRKLFKSRTSFSEAVLAVLKEKKVQVIVLAGFMHVLTAEFCAEFDGRIVNVHPSLIPSFCGEGFYGLKVHEAALEYGVKVTGATVHLVTEVVDGGRILRQKAVDVLEGDTPETLQQRVMREAEWVILPQAVNELCGEILKKNM